MNEARNERVRLNSSELERLKEARDNRDENLPLGRVVYLVCEEAADSRGGVRL